MNQGSLGNNYNVPPVIPVKRKRGRPRKDSSFKLLNSAHSAHVPPGFEGVNGNRPHHVEPSGNRDDGTVGEAVTGVVEAAFDAGYLLSVRIGNSNTSLRGVVFKPGHYVPVTTENDVAPHVQMVRRNEIHLPAESQTRVRGHASRSRERSVQHANYLVNVSPPANQAHGLTTNQGLSKGKYASATTAPSVPPVGARGTVVPVVLQPVNLLNGVPPANQFSPTTSQVACMAAPESKRVHTVAPLAVYAPNGLTFASQEQASPPRTSHKGTSRDLQNENCPDHVTPGVLSGEEDKSIKTTGVLMVEGAQGSSQSGRHGENSKATSKSLAEDVQVASKQEIGDMNEPLVIEPLQVVHSDHHIHQSASIFNPLESNRTGRLTELLQALQDNMTENLVPQVDNTAKRSGFEFHELENSNTDIGDGETNE